MYASLLFRSLVVAASLTVSPLVSAAVYNCEPDPGDDTLVEYGDTVYCTLENQGDIDTFRFVGSQGDRVVISVYNTESSRIRIELLDPAGATRGNQYYYIPARIDLTLDQDGPWTLLVRPYDAISSPLAYELQIPCVLGDCVIHPPPKDTAGYVPVTPCRIVNQLAAGVPQLQAGDPQSFLAYGTATQLAAQGGNECPNPNIGIAPVAIAANVTAVGALASGNGNIVAYPSFTAPPSSSLVNFRRGTNIANAAIIPLCDGDLCPGDFDLMSNFANIPAIVDVQGYFYKTP